MLRKRHQYRLLTAAFLFALIGVAFFAGYAGIRSSTLNSQTQSAQPPTQAGHQWRQQPEGFWERAADPVAIATLALVLVTFLMTRAIREQVRLARDEFNATHRPRFIIRTVEQCTEMISGLLGASIDYVNVGDASGTIRELRGKILYEGEILRPGILETVPPASLKVRAVAPGEIGSVALFSAYTPEAIETTTQHAQRLMCIGYLRYTDANGIERRTGFCRRYDKGNRLWHREENEDYEYSY